MAGKRGPKPKTTTKKSKNDEVEKDVDDNFEDDSGSEAEKDMAAGSKKNGDTEKTSENDSEGGEGDDADKADEPAAKKGRGRGRKPAPSKGAGDDDDDEDDEPKPKRGRGRPKKAGGGASKASSGGAKKGRGRPKASVEHWEMALIVHGFPNEISALRFEWAWQHPQKSRRLRHLPPKKSKESAYEYRFRLLSHMLQVGPWKRLPLTVRWLTEERILNFQPSLMPPSHMPIAYGSVKSIKVGKPRKTTSDVLSSPGKLMSVSRTEEECALCHLLISAQQKRLECLVPKCKAVFHPICLSERFLTGDRNYIIPVQGDCPKCHQNLLWGDLVRFACGCYRDLLRTDTEGSSSS